MESYPDGAYYAALAVFAIVWFIVAVAVYVVGSIFLMKIFEKAGVEGKWRAWVPIYNFMVFSKLGDLSPWLVLIALGAGIVLSWIPVIGQLLGLAGFVLTLLAAWRVGLKLQKEAVWLILYFFLSLVWLGINAFDKSRWNTAIPAAPWAGNGFLSDKTVWAGIPSQVPAGGFPANPATTPGAYPPPPAGYQPPPPPAGYAPPPSATPSTPPPAAAPSTPPPADPPAAPDAPPAAPEPPTAPDAPKQ